MVQRVRRLSLREQALDSLRAAILDGELKPGTHLGEVALSEELHVSRGTMREALRILQQAGLVETAPRGLQVRNMGPRDVRDLYETRGALEALAVRSVMRGADPVGSLEALSAALPAEDAELLEFSECLESDLHFHRTLLELSGNRVLQRTWRDLQDQMRVAIVASSAPGVRRLMGRHHHEPIVRAMVAGDVDEASALVVRHMDAAADVLIPQSE